MADGVDGPWDVEEIADEEILYRRIHTQWFVDGELTPGAFKDYEMSTDWKRYSSAEEARQRARNPNLNAVVSLVAGEARHYAGQLVQHAPLPENRAHTNVIGEKSLRVRQRLLDICTVELQAPRSRDNS